MEEIKEINLPDCIEKGEEITKEEAEELFHKDLDIYLLDEMGIGKTADTIEEIQNHQGKFAGRVNQMRAYYDFIEVVKESEKEIQKYFGNDGSISML